MSSKSLTWTLTHHLGTNGAECNHTVSAAEPMGAFSHRDIQTGISACGMWRGDNAAHLCSQLKLDENSDFEAIICRAWQTWGKTLAAHLQGPFAISLFDEGNRALYLARDALGVEPLFLARTQERIAASSCPRTARRAAQLISKPDPIMIADFVRGQISSKSATFHADLTRVTPGSWLLITPEEERGEAYWSFSSTRQSVPEDDPAAHFGSLLAREIALCGSHDDHLAVLLSGGLDSSAVAALCDDIRQNDSETTTLSLTYDSNPDWVDGPHIAAMRAILDMKHHSLPSESHDPFKDIDDVLIALDGPSFGYGTSVSNTLFSYAHAQGLRTVLHGHGGDEVVSYGIGRLNELAQAGQWLAVWRETEGAAGLWSESRWRIFKRYLSHWRAWRWLRKRWQQRPTRQISQLNTDIVAPALSRFIDRAVAPNPRPETRPDHTERDLHLAALQHPVQPHALETTILRGRFYGLKIGMPFMSRDLVEFSLSLPSHWKLRNGYTRFILREAIRPFVPASIANRRDKNDFTQDFVDGFLASPFAREYADPYNAKLTQYVNQTWLIENWAKVERDGRSVSIKAVRGLWRAAVLGRWLAMDRDAGILTGEQGQQEAE